MRISMVLGRIGAGKPSAEIVQAGAMREHAGRVRQKVVRLMHEESAMLDSRRRN
jgi:hypothetical protein